MINDWEGACNVDFKLCLLSGRASTDSYLKSETKHANSTSATVDRRICHKLGQVLHGSGLGKELHLLTTSYSGDINKLR